MNNVKDFSSKSIVELTQDEHDQYEYGYFSCCSEAGATINSHIPLEYRFSKDYINMSSDLYTLLWAKLDYHDLESLSYEHLYKNTDRTIIQELRKLDVINDDNQVEQYLQTVIKKLKYAFSKNSCTPDLSDFQFSKAGERMIEKNKRSYCSDIQENVDFALSSILTNGLCMVDNSDNYRHLGTNELKSFQICIGSEIADYEFWMLSRTNSCCLAVGGELKIDITNLPMWANIRWKPLNHHLSDLSDVSKFTQQYDNIMLSRKDLKLKAGEVIDRFHFNDKVTTTSMKKYFSDMCMIPRTAST